MTTYGHCQQCGKGIKYRDPFVEISIYTRWPDEVDRKRFHVPCAFPKRLR